MPRWALILALCVAAASGWWASVPPTPDPRPGAAGFDVANAMADIRAGFARPHPIGSAEAARTHDWLAARMRALGLEVRVQPTSAVHIDRSGMVGGDLVNLIGVLPGRDRARPALLLMSHHDSVPSSPGAADDGFGVASALEIVRALKASGTPARDVIVLFTDGEEAGLLGARAFFATDPIRSRVGMVLNMDTRGDAGRAIMYETGPMPGGLLRLYARETHHPTTDSIAAFVRKSIRNSSDFAISGAAGLPGLNYAVTGDQFDYHAASSTPNALDRASLAQFGGQVLAMARVLSAATEWPAPAPEPAYASLLGLTTIVYPFWVGWILLAAAALIGGAASVRRSPAFTRERWRGVGTAVGIALAGALVFHLMRLATSVPFGFTAVRPLLARWSLFEAALLLAGTAVLGVALSGRGGKAAGLFLVMLLLATIVQALAPAAAVLAVWTVLAGAIIWLLAASRRPFVIAAAAILAGLTLGQIAATGHLILLAVGENMPAAGACFLLLAALPLAPLAERRSGLRIAAIACGIAAIAAIGVIRFTDHASPARPRPSQILYVAAADGRFWRASSLPAIDPWTDAALKADGARRWVRRPLPPFHVGRDYAQGAAVAPARPVRVDAPAIVHAPGSLTVAPPLGARQIDLQLRFRDAVSLRVKGADGRLDAVAGQLVSLRWSASRAPLTILIDSGHNRVAGLVSILSDGWPADARPLAPRSPDTMPWYNSDATLVIRRIDLRW